MKVINYTLASLTLILASTVVTATPPEASPSIEAPKDKAYPISCKHHKNGHSQNFKKIAEKLALTDDQKKKVAALRKHKMKIMKSIHTEMETLQKEFFQLAPEASNYKAKVFEIAAKKGRLLERMIIEKGEMRYLITSLLTPEQLVARKKLFTETKKAAEATKATVPVTK